MTLKALTAAACALTLVVPAVASAQHGGGGHGGGGRGGASFHSGGFGGGYRGGGYRGGGYRGGFGGYGYGYGYGYGFPYYGFGLGLGLGALYASSYYGPYSYYPSSYWDYGYDPSDYADYGGYGGGYGGSAPPQGGDPWAQEYGSQQGAPFAPPPNTVAPTSSVPAGAAGCGRWVWSAGQSRYNWDQSGC